MGATLFSYSIDSSSFISLQCHIPLTQNKTKAKAKQSLPPWLPVRRPMLSKRKESSPISKHGLVWLTETSGTKDDLQPPSSQSPAHTPPFLWFSEVLWPHHVTECRTCDLSVIWKKDPGDAAWTPQLFAWRNKARFWRSNSKRCLCWDSYCPLQNQLCSPIPGSFQSEKLSQWAKMIHRSFIYVANEEVFLKGSCTDLALLLLISMAELQLTPAGVELGWWEIILKVSWKKSLNHICFPFSPSLHTSTPFSWSH